MYGGRAGLVYEVGISVLSMLPVMFARICRNTIKRFEFKCHHCSIGGVQTYDHMSRKSWVAPTTKLRPRAFSKFCFWWSGTACHLTALERVAARVADKKWQKRLDWGSYKGSADRCIDLCCSSCQDSSISFRTTVMNLLSLCWWSRVGHHLHCQLFGQTWLPWIQNFKISKCQTSLKVMPSLCYLDIQCYPCLCLVLLFWLLQPCLLSQKLGSECRIEESLFTMPSGGKWTMIGDNESLKRWSKDGKNIKNIMKHIGKHDEPGWTHHEWWRPHNES